MNNNNIWYRQLNKSTLTPPERIFGIVWTILYCLIALSIVWIWFYKYKYSPKILQYAIFAFGFQICTNFLWPIIFFRLRAIKLSLIIIILNWISIIVNIYWFYRLDPIASYLLIPYLVWVSFAIYLNAYIVSNN